jgi:hypothetical protein
MLNPCDERKHEVLGVSQKELQKAFCRKKRFFISGIVDFRIRKSWVFLSRIRDFAAIRNREIFISGIMSNRNLELWYIFRLLFIPIIVSSDIQGICFSLVSMMEKRGLFLEQCR